MNYSLLRYPGGKTKAVPALMQYIPEGTQEICSPFFGGGSFEIALNIKGINVHGYDNFKPLVCFWEAVMIDRERLCASVESYFPLSKERFYQLQKEILTYDDETEIGAVFYVLNRASFSGAGLSGGMSPNHPRFTQSSITKLRNFRQEFIVNQLSFEQSIPKHDCLIYADPPYMIEQFLYGNKGDMHRDFDHIGLHSLLNNRGNFILSYNNCEQIKDMYHEHEFFYPNWKYGMGNDKDSKEIVIVSKDLIR